MQHSTANDGPTENGEPDGYPQSALRSWLLFQVAAKLNHQMRNHLTVAQNARFTLDRAMEKQDQEKIDKSLEMATLGFQRLEGVLKTWMLFNSEQPHAVRILEHYRKRFSNSGVELLFPLNDELVEDLLPAIVYSLEHLRTRLIRGAVLEIRVEENRVQVEQSKNEEIAPPPEMGDVLNHYFRLKPYEKGWEITKKGDAKS